MALTSAERRRLKAAAHHLKPVIQTGAQGLTNALNAEAELAIAHHELIKVRLAGAEREQRREMAAALAQTLQAELVTTIGAVAVLYRARPET